MSRIDALRNAVKKAQSNSSSEYTQLETYYPTRDAAGNAMAVIRFLPGKTDADIPFTKSFAHGFKGPTGKWYIEECPTTIGGECPCCEANGEMVNAHGKWDTTPESVKTIVRERKRKVSYFANILVIEDKKHPENEGKTFLFKFGQKIFDMIADKIEPEFEDETPCDVFDMKEGADFTLKIRKVDNQTNYGKSSFEATSACSAKIDFDALYDLTSLTAPEKYKSKEELTKRLTTALGNIDRLAAKKTALNDDDDDNGTPTETKETAEPKAEKTEKKSKPVAEAKKTDDDDDEIMRMMKEIEAGGAAKED